MDNQLSCTINRHGVSFSKSVIRERESHAWSERAYQRLAPKAFDYLPEDVRQTWVFGFMPVNIGFDVFPDSMDIFQILPKGPTKSVIRTPLFVRPDTRREAKVMQYLANRINMQIGHEDKVLCERVQAGPLQLQLPAGSAQRIRDAGEGHACAHPRRLPDRHAEGAADGRHAAPAEPEDAGATLSPSTGTPRSPLSPEGRRRAAALAPALLASAVRAPAHCPPAERCCQPSRS